MLGILAAVEVGRTSPEEQQGLMEEEGVLEQQAIKAATELDLTPGEALIADILLAIHKRQRDSIMLSLRTSNG